MRIVLAVGLLLAASAGKTDDIWGLGVNAVLDSTIRAGKPAILTPTSMGVVRVDPLPTFGGENPYACISAMVELHKAVRISRAKDGPRCALWPLVESESAYLRCQADMAAQKESKEAKLADALAKADAACGMTPHE